jgi:hypothetical protein
MRLPAHPLSVCVSTMNAAQRVGQGEVWRDFRRLSPERQPDSRPHVSPTVRPRTKLLARRASPVASAVDVQTEEPITMDDGEATADDGGRWMTYPEIAALRRITRASAERLVQRRRWRRQADNRGHVRAYVPGEWCEPPPLAVQPDIRNDIPQDIAPIVAPLQAAIAALQQQLEYATRQADRAETRAEQAENRAILAESGCNSERSRADALRERLDDLTAKLNDAQAELAAAQDQAEAAQIAQGEAEADAAELRQAADASRALGRWARIRRAWRG